MCMRVFGEGFENNSIELLDTVPDVRNDDVYIFAMMRRTGAMKSILRGLLVHQDLLELRRPQSSLLND
jgi:hypothetical protein